MTRSSTTTTTTHGPSAMEQNAEGRDYAVLPAMPYRTFSTTSVDSTASHPISPAPGDHPTIQVTQLSSRSLSTVAIQAFVRPFRNQIAKPKEHPGGSLKLKVPDDVHEHCVVHERTVADIRIYDVNVRADSTFDFLAHIRKVSEIPPTKSSQSDNYGSVAARASKSLAASAGLPSQPITALPHSEEPAQLERHTSNILVRWDSTDSRDGDHFAPLTRGATDPTVRTRDWAIVHGGDRKPRPRHIYYFAGGSWQNPPSSDHWKLVVHLARTLSKNGTSTTVSIVSAPLAPHTPVTTAFPMLERMYYEIFRTGAVPAADAPDTAAPALMPDPEIVLAGDSSGGNIALALTLHVLSKDPDAPAPASLMLISPSVDFVTEGKPELAEISKKDPVLSLKAIEQNHIVWTGGKLDYEDPRVSPIRGDLSVLRRRGVRVNGVNGGNDVLSPDVKALIAKLNRARVEGQWLDWEKQMHCFPLTFSYGISEGKKGVEWIINAIETAARLGLSESRHGSQASLVSVVSVPASGVVPASLPGGSASANGNRRRGSGSPSARSSQFSHSSSPRASARSPSTSQSQLAASRAPDGAAASRSGSSTPGQPTPTQSNTASRTGSPSRRYGVVI